MKYLLVALWVVMELQIWLLFNSLDGHRAMVMNNSFKIGWLQGEVGRLKDGPVSIPVLSFD